MHQPAKDQKDRPIISQEKIINGSCSQDIEMTSGPYMDQSSIYGNFSSDKSSLIVKSKPPIYANTSLSYSENKRNSIIQVNRIETNFTNMINEKDSKFFKKQEKQEKISSLKKSTCSGSLMIAEPTTFSPNTESSNQTENSDRIVQTEESKPRSNANESNEKKANIRFRFEPDKSSLTKILIKDSASESVSLNSTLLSNAKLFKNPSKRLSKGAQKKSPSQGYFNNIYLS